MSIQPIINRAPKYFSRIKIILSLMVVSWLLELFLIRNLSFFADHVQVTFWCLVGFNLLSIIAVLISLKKIESFDSPIYQNAAIEIFEDSEDLINIFNLNGNILYSNHTSRDFFQFDDEFENQSKLQKNKVNFDLFHTLINKTAESTRTKLEAALVSEKTARSIIFSHTSFLIQTPTEPLVCITSKDLTELKALQHKLIDSARLASIGEMASGIAHEINNPLSIIKGKLTIVMRDLDKLSIRDEKLISDLNKIDLTAERIVRIVKSLGNLARSSEYDEFVVADLKTIVAECLEMVSERFSSDSVSIISSIEEGLTIVCRPTEIAQIIVNLLCNAYDAVKTLPDRWVKVTGSSFEDEGVLLRVIDSGFGISPDIQEKIMIPFFSTKPAGQGTGLGLSICRALVLSHEGALEYQLFESHTSFKVSLKRLSTAP